MESNSRLEMDGVRVLIVDGNATNRELLSASLAASNMRPSVVQDGAEALTTLGQALDKQDPFGIAVIDTEMKDMDGVTLGRIILGDQHLKKTRLILVAPVGAKTDARQLTEMGFAALATKPIRHSEFKTLLLTVLKNGSGVTMPLKTATESYSDLRNIFAWHKGRILVADDNFTNQKVALGILRKFGLTGDAVSDGVEALQALDASPYSLVLMDVHMPEMDGLEATRQIRAREARDLLQGVHRHIPIVAMTAGAMQIDRENCFKAGMDAYTSKPIVPKVLAEAIGQWLPDENKGDDKVAATDQCATASGQDAAVFDMNTLLSRVMDDSELAGQLLDSFLEDMPRQIQALMSFVEAGSLPNIEKQAHRIHGAAANVGGESMRAVAFEMEMAGKAGDLESVMARRTELDRQFVRLREAIATQRLQ